MAKVIINVVLLELDLPTYHDGFDYLLRNIGLLVRNISRQLTKDVYPTVGRESVPAVGWKQVESSIRYSIEQEHQDRDKAKWEIYFRHPEVCPGNKVFLTRMALIAELREKLRDEEVRKQENTARTEGEG